MKHKPTPRGSRRVLDELEVPLKFYEPVEPTPRSVGRPAHVPTEMDRETVRIMAAGGIQQADIAAARGITENTLRLHYRHELDTGKAQIDELALTSHVNLMKAGDFQAVKWWQQARMGWRGEARDMVAAPQPMRVVVEFVGEGAPVPRTINHAPVPDDYQSLEEMRKNVQLVG